MENTLKVRVTGSCWPTHNFSTGNRGPDVSPGEYDVKRITVPKTGRPAIVLADPAAVGAGADDLVGADEEYLRHGKATATIVD